MTPKVLYQKQQLLYDLRKILEVIFVAIKVFFLLPFAGEQNYLASQVFLCLNWVVRIIKILILRSAHYLPFNTLFYYVPTTRLPTTLAILN